MKTRITLLSLLLSMAVLAFADHVDYICESKHIGTSAVAVSCKNGADPTGTKIGTILLISCGK